LAFKSKNKNISFYIEVSS